MNFDQIAKDFQNISKVNGHRAWESFMKKYDCKRICELGVYRGDNFMRMIAHEPELAVAVDAWKDSGIHPRKYDDYAQEEFEEQHKFFQSRVADKPFVQIIRDDTTKTAELFPDNYFDFVYVDADHSYEACYKDVTAWYAKVKPGKFLAGHDYRRGFGVVEAVNDFLKGNNLQLIHLPPSNWLVIKK